MNSAIGMVAAMVKVPQGLPFSAFTTTSATTASRMTMMMQHGDQRDEAADLADLLARHLAERFAVAAHGGEQDDEILHGAAQHRADDDPERARQIAELRGQHRSDQRSRAGDGGEVVAEDDPFVGGLEIVAVAQPLGGRGALVVERHHARGDEFGVKAIADGVGAGRGQHQPDAVDVLAAVERDAAQADRRHGSHGGPQEYALESSRPRVY